MNNQLATYEQPMTALDIQQQVNTIQQVMKQVMTEGTHFGKIPGTKSPTLYKPGAEKIMATFRLSADPDVTDMSDGDQIRYLVKVRLASSSGVFVGAGIGECSSNEEKYKWRASICPEEFEATVPERKREKWSKGRWDDRNRCYGPPIKVPQIRTEPADIANTILKMAKKRALIDAVLTATAASDIFTQDIEDLPEEFQGHDVVEPKPEGPKSKSGNMSETATEAQVRLLKVKLSQNNKDELDLCGEFEIEAIESLPFAKVNDAISWITQ